MTSPQPPDDAQNAGTLGYQPVVPAVEVGPVPQADRVVGIDVVRGVALLGILLLNIRTFGMISDAYIYPFADSAIDEAAFAITTTFAQGKFITIFSGLFGVGLLLASRRREEQGLPVWPTFLRRTALLAMIGLAHMLLIWFGDILFHYALIGIVAFSMRGLNAKVLALLAVVGHLTAVAISAFFLGLALLAVQFDDSIASSADVLLMTDAAVEAEVEGFTGGYADQLQARLGLVAIMQPFLLFLAGPATLGSMLGGIALWKCGFFTTRLPSIALCVVLLAIGWGGTGALVYWHWGDDWPVGRWMFLATTLVPLLAVPSAVGIAGLVLRMQKPLSLLAVVGKTALSNYLFQSVVATFVFYGGWGLGYFGTIGYAGQIGVVVGIWLVQVPLSYLWLKAFRFGPVEWLWRSATYARLVRLRSTP